MLDKNRRLSEIYNRMDNFVHAVAHDLRTPLVNLKMLTDLLERSQEEKERLEYQELIGKSVKRLDNTLNGLVQIIEVENESNLLYRKLSFSEITSSILADFNKLIAESQAQIETHFEDCPTVEYVEPYLFSILKNLLSNALK